MKYSLFISFVLFNHTLYSQNDHGKTTQYFVYGGLGVSTIKTNKNNNPSNFVTPELRLGAGVQKYFWKNFGLYSRLAFGIKMKRDAGYTMYAVPFNTIQKMSSKNHYYLEFPVLVEYVIPETAFSISAGSDIRYIPYFGFSSEYSFYKKWEIGLLSMASYRLNQKVKMGLEIYFGLTEIFGGIYSINYGPLTEFNGRSRFALLSINYRLGQ